MKLQFLSLLALLSSVFVMNCETTQIATAYDYGQMSEINEVKFNKKVIFAKTMTWIATGATGYPSPTKEIDYSDKESGLIIVKGVSIYHQNANQAYNFYYKLTITIKDRKYKIEMTPDYLIDRNSSYVINLNRIPPEFAREYGRLFRILNQSLNNYIIKGNISDF